MAAGRFVMLLFSVLKTLIGEKVTIELKNDMKITGILESVDQYHNIKIEQVSVDNQTAYPHLSAVKSLFIRGSVVRYVHLPASAVDTALLEDASRREARAHSGQPIAGN